MSEVHLVVPAGIEDPARPSGGNVYDQRVCSGLPTFGWTVRRHDVLGSWPRPARESYEALAAVLAGVPDRAVVVVDGLVVSAAAGVVVPHGHRLRLVVLLHMPLGAAPESEGLRRTRAQEREVLGAASAVVTASDWTRQWLLRNYALPSGRVHVAEPGVDAAPVAPGTASGGELLCVAAVTRSKGHDVLVAALGRLTAEPWRCTVVGATDLEPAYVSELRRRIEEHGIADRVDFTGPLAGRRLEASYAGADLLVLPSRAETYGMVVTEALARGVPVVAASVGGVPAALGAGTDGGRPGLLVPPDDAPALAAALQAWLADAGLRARLRATAGERRSTLAGWSVTVGAVSRVLTEVSG